MKGNPTYTTILTLDRKVNDFPVVGLVAYRLVYNPKTLEPKHTTFDFAKSSTDFINLKYLPEKPSYTVRYCDALELRIEDALYFEAKYFGIFNPTSWHSYSQYLAGLEKGLETLLASSKFTHRPLDGSNPFHEVQ